jgi:Na+/proline symporter
MPPPGYYPPPQQRFEADDGGPITAVFPYKNGKALSAYYLGCFSFIIPVLAIPAVIFGILGYRAYQQEPRLRGAAHAVIGMLAGLIAVLLWLLMVYSWSTL